MMQREFAGRTTTPPNVQRLNIFQDGRIGGARVLQVNGPLDRGKIVVFDGHATDDQT